MYLNDESVNVPALSRYRESLSNSCPNHIVIDGLFDEDKLNEVVNILQQEDYWQTQKHTYSALYVDDNQWQQASKDERFVQRGIWQCDELSGNNAQDFLSFLRGDEFMSVLSCIFNVQLTDITVEDPAINTNYFRLGARDFVEQHADDSPGREVCMLLYLNKDWAEADGGELVFIGEDDAPVRIAPLFNRCVLFDPSSKGSEHWVEKMNPKNTEIYRYNITSWYWSV
ncbi:2OG-Fe(II) oxygenase [Lentisphaera profundi]|uniref:2OG-Fe(II) oxygenase n=1 Tax=Lentisphaera profundi TaxID=1658616 RepID=A0ABY7VU76_9BACT|nr:2OG-Fe(II) oxygenase [Lentisphaera profundi]WDE97760.1 2OG-Fe(II) oxygenase [Lentisphaera profundi]